MAIAFGICMSAAVSVQAADFGSGAGQNVLFTDGTGSWNTEEGEISGIANRIVEHAWEQAEEYQELKDEAQKVADAKEVQRRAEEVRVKAAEIRKESLEQSARREEEREEILRQKIVNFALRFEGNPYVYGGTSLTNGADCSGFVMSVFKEFGYELPRVASAQFEASQKKSVSEIEKGDLVFYGSGGIGHVALYIGHGKIIHASNSAAGIKISDFDYETPAGVGTYLI